MEQIRNALRKLERLINRYAITHLMTYLVYGMAGVYAFDMLIGPFTHLYLSNWLYFSRALILRGQIWRLVTFVLVPPSGSILSTLLSLYFYWIIGSTLESQWGRTKFNAYYLVGMLGCVISGFIAGTTTNAYLNMSLLLAFALLNPDYTVLLFFFLPIKMKWLGIFEALMLLMTFLSDSWAGRLALIFAILNLILFFGGDLLNAIRNMYRRWQWKKNWR